MRAAQLRVTSACVVRSVPFLKILRQGAFSIKIPPFFSVFRQRGEYFRLSPFPIWDAFLGLSIFSKKKVTLVNVWNVGCTPCVNEIPDLDKINSEYKDKGAAVYGLYGDLGMGISDDEMAQIKDIMSNANASYTQLRMDGTLATNESLLNIMAYPTTYVVGSEGPILDTIEGSKDYEGWKALIDSYLAE